MNEVQALTEERNTLRLALAQSCEEHALTVSLLADEIRELRLLLEARDQEWEAILRTQLHAADQALRNLMGELSDLHVAAVREGLGNTNAAVLKRRLEEARAHLTARPTP